jgi:fructoselysine-6-P-deglycase FrlB-like protein
MTEQTTSPAPTGLELIRAEQARQLTDALATVNNPALEALALRIAGLIKRPGASLLLLGMGASHHANSAALAAYRACGVTAFAVTLDEALTMPLPPSDARVNLIVSQSGGSGEIRSFLGTLGPDRPNNFGLSLNPDGYLATQVPTLLASGGPEVGFAATRSYLLTLVLHGLVVSALGGSRTLLLETFTQPHHTPDPKVLGEAQSVVFAGSGSLSGLAAMAALGSIELGRFPALHYDLGQFRHGPLELLTPEVGVVLLCHGGKTAYQEQTLLRITEACHSAGSPLLSLTSRDWGTDPLAPLCSSLDLAIPVQQLVIALAIQRVEAVGEPLRSSKVTT